MRKKLAPSRESVRQQPGAGSEDEEDAGLREETAEEEMSGLCEYKRIRLRNIQHKEAFFAELAIKEAGEARRNTCRPASGR